MPCRSSPRQDLLKTAVVDQIPATHWAAPEGETVGMTRRTVIRLAQIGPRMLIEGFKNFPFREDPPDGPCRSSDIYAGKKGRALDEIIIVKNRHGTVGAIDVLSGAA